MAILHRKNSLFYKTDNGAHVGDLYMSLIHTCQLNGADPFDYLTQLQRHTKKVRAHPDRWMPWNYRRALQRVFRSMPNAIPLSCRSPFRSDAEHPSAHADQRGFLSKSA